MHYVHTMFYENQSTSFKVELGTHWIPMLLSATVLSLQTQCGMSIADRRDCSIYHNTDITRVIQMFCSNSILNKAYKTLLNALHKQQDTNIIFNLFCVSNQNFCTNNTVQFLLISVPGM